MPADPAEPRRWWIHLAVWPLLTAILTVTVHGFPESRPQTASYQKVGASLQVAGSPPLRSAEELPTRLLPITRLWGPDYIQFWSASKIVLERGNPYDAAAQTQHQAAAGWDRDEDGLGKYDFLPYYYPPWVAVVLTPLVPAGYALAKSIWLALLMVAILAAAFLLRRSVPGLSEFAVMALFCACALWWTTVTMGQVAPWVVLLLAATWRLAESGHDRSAGWTLAGLSLKPQLTVVVVIAAMVWAVRQRRWRILAGWLTACAALVLVSTVAAPRWWSALAEAFRTTPLVTIDNPALGTTWFTLLQVAGCQGALLWGLYAVVALPVAATILWLAWRRDTALPKLLAGAILGTFVIAPYAQYYDLPVLLTPLLWLLGQPLPARARQALLAAFLVVPAALWFYLPQPQTTWGIEGRWLWMLLVLGGAWCWANSATRRHALAG